jgi:hypothetical protein
MQVHAAAQSEVSWFLIASVAAVLMGSPGCSRDSAPVQLEAGSSVALGPAPATAAASMEPCTPHDKLISMPCRNGERNVDVLPAISGAGIELSHCPLDDCGSGGCTYDVYGIHLGCLRKLGSVHGVSIDVAVADASAAPPSIRTWGRSGTTHIATEYDVLGGTLQRRRQFVCDYGSGKPLLPECPKL